MKHTYVSGLCDGRQRSIDDPHTCYPTHRCFEDAAAHIVQVAAGKPVPLLPVCATPAHGEMLSRLVNGGTRRDWRLVHGIITVSGTRLAHAWVECRRAGVGSMVFETHWFRGERVHPINFAFDWRRTFVPDRCQRYSVDWVMSQANSDRTCGPWDEALQHLCSRVA